MTYSASKAKTGTAAGTTFTVALMGVAVRAFGKLTTALKNRRQIAQLHHLDDRSLKDIGLIRSDVHEALGVSLFRDPSQHLVDVAGEKRGGVRSVGSVPAQDMNRLRRLDASVTTAMSAGACKA
jgi:uncharacterized protein YjiS (DUF1127 family)